MIIGWFVAVYVSRPAGRLGRYYSRGKMDTLQATSVTDAFEKAIGVFDERRSRKMSMLAKKEELKNALADLDDDALVDLRESVVETTATLMAEGKIKST